MKKLYAMAALAMGAASVSHAAHTPKAEKDIDSTKVAEMQEVVVSAVKAKKDAPFAKVNIGRKDLEQFSRTGQELPFLFARTPGVMAWSENGLGTGTTYMRIRGAADSRINVTIDGVALNSPEDQCVFWANMNSYASFLGAAQIQRGVGTSTNGDGAFGGSIALQTLAPSFDPTVQVNLSAGSYGTANVGAQFSTGLNGIRLKKHYLVLDGAYHHTTTEGYVHGTSGNSGSYYGSLSFINDKGNFKLSYKNIGNYEHTGQAWNGVTAGDNDNSLIEGSNINWGSWPASINSTGITTYKDMYDAGLGRFNSLYEYLVSKDGKNSFADANGNYETQRYQMSDGSYWSRTTDNFWQNKSLLNATWKINNHWNLTATGHYTRGKGYYDEFRYNNKLKKFGLETLDGMPSKTDFVRQKGLTQDCYGGVVNAFFTNDKWDVQMGVSAQNFEGNHWGYLTYIKDEAVRKYYMKNGDYKYYDSDARKTDIQTFAKATYHVSKSFDVFGDVQYRYVGYKTDGINDKFVKDENGKLTNQRLDIDEKYNFCNPKVGVSFHNGGHNAYLSYALSHREPERNNFTDNGKYDAPSPESVHDIELGYGYTARNWFVSANLYYMLYHNQFVQTGELSDIGENLTTNIKSSYRRGIELSAGYSPLSWFSIEGNAALSQNVIKDFDEVVSVDWENSFKTIHYDNSTLAFSPAVILNGFLDFHYKGFTGVWHTNYVGRQYLDNTECTLRSLPAYTTTAIHLSYDLKPHSKKMANNIKDIIFGVDMNNIFNRHFAQSGWVYSSLITDSQTGGPTLDRYTQIGWIPCAGFTCMGSVTFKF